MPIAGGLKSKVNRVCATLVMCLDLDEFLQVSFNTGHVLISLS